MTERSYLYVPGDRKDMLEKALKRSADAVVVDLEDGVAMRAKSDARKTVRAWLETIPPDANVWLRLDAQNVHADLEGVAYLDRLAGVFLPKASVRLSDLANSLPPALQIVPLIETARAVRDVDEIASMPRVRRLGIGEADLIADLGMSPAAGHAELASIRVNIVVASAVARLDPPIGSVRTDYRDLKSLGKTTSELKRIGFGARTAIHPTQVAVINTVFTPTKEEVARARRLVERLEQSQAEGVAIILGDSGEMVDEAVARRARRILALAERHGAG